MIVIDENYDFDDFVDQVVEELMRAELGTVFRDKQGVDWMYYGYRRAENGPSIDYLLVAGVVRTPDLQLGGDDGCKMFSASVLGHARIRIEVVPDGSGGWFQMSELHVPEGGSMIYG